MTPQWYFMYRGNGYGPFDSIGDAYTKFCSKGGPHDRPSFYHYYSYYGNARVERQQLIEFKHCPKPFMFSGWEPPKRDIGWLIELNHRMFPCGYST